MLDQLLGLGLAESTTAKRRLAELESRQEDLRRGIARLEGELAALEGRELNARLLVEALRDFRGLYDRLTADERKDMLRLLIHRVDVWKGRLEVHFLDGRDARVRLEELRAADLRQNPEPQNAEKRTTRRFAFRIEWLPVADAYAKFLRAPGADGMVQMEFVGRVMEESGFSPRAQ